MLQRFETFMKKEGIIKKIHVISRIYKITLDKTDELCIIRLGAVKES